MTQHPEHIAYILGIAGALTLVWQMLNCHVVTDVNDGDGIQIKLRFFPQVWFTILQKLRLGKCDAPETKGNQFWGYEAKAFLKWLVLGKPVRISIIGKNQDRWVCMVYLFGFISVSWLMVLTGNAENYPEYGGRYYWEQWIAQRLHLGIWKNGTKNYIRPCEFRDNPQLHKKVVKLPSSKKAKRK